MNKISLKMKLGLGFGALLLIIAMMGIMSYTSIDKLSDLSNEVTKQMHKTLLATHVDSGLELQTSAIRGYLISGSEGTLKRNEEGTAQSDKAMEELNKLLTTESGKALFTQVDAATKELRDTQSRVIELRRKGNTKEATELLFSEHTTQSRSNAEKSIDELIAEIDKLQAASQKEHDQVEASTVRLVVGLAIVGMLVGVGVAFLIVRSITGPIFRMVAVIQEIANKNLTIEDMKITSEDEIGKAGIALNEMKNSLHEVIQTMRDTAEQVAAASEELSATSQQITANSEETTAQAQVVSEAGGQVNTNLQTLASGAEEMNSTIGEIAKNATEAARVAGEAVEAAEAANQTVSLLGDSSVEIGKVIEVITSIAQQTNLLALNATIEAARAGEAGKGFAVVANEVKELAKQTAKATEEIKQKIGVIRDNTGGAVAAIGGIKGVIDKISHISTVIATAVEEQSATTSEMTRNVSEAARGASTISDNIKGVADAAQNTSTNVGEAQIATEHLSKMANQLRDLVGGFKVGKESTERQNEGRLLKAAGHAAGAR